ncbi:zf-TFIIB domain-containing protein [Cohnella zeiphila]|uniref:Zf-TFIIB domain-containing protein n=1 Tax=Cohnella zeiphila TaxID=2761120 RepID=A0A7X0SS69_9BACL|nr:zf-TFIIB domain-containing protein [Cohnella zeiphila]MBB6733935.1 zf-TFIIB domain-containing protein [Cohnella zeiphila]
MNCPVCSDSRMREVEKDGVLIDICPSCKGVWLDRGELDKLMKEVREVRDDYNEWYYNDERRGSRSDGYPPPREDDRRYEGGYGGHGGHGSKHKKKRSVMDVFGDLFD